MGLQQTIQTGSDLLLSSVYHKWPVVTISVVEVSFLCNNGRRRSRLSTTHPEWQFCSALSHHWPRLVLGQMTISFLPVFMSVSFAMIVVQLNA